MTNASGSRSSDAGPLRWLFGSEGWPYLLAPMIPLAIVLELAHASDVAIFATSALGVIPPAALMGRATEELAARSGPGIGGLLNVTFGNFPELVIAFFALLEGLQGRRCSSAAWVEKSRRSIAPRLALSRPCCCSRWPPS